MKVFFHGKNSNGQIEANQMIELSILPRKGEYVSLSASSSYYLVQTVLHCAFDDTDCVAEVFAVEDHATMADMF